MEIVVFLCNHVPAWLGASVAGASMTARITVAEWRSGGVAEWRSGGVAGKCTVSVISVSPLVKCLKETQRNECLAQKSVTLSIENNLKCTASFNTFHYL